MLLDAHAWYMVARCGILCSPMVNGCKECYLVCFQVQPNLNSLQQEKNETACDSLPWQYYASRRQHIYDTTQLSLIYDM